MAGSADLRESRDDLFFAGDMVDALFTTLEGKILLQL
jgi:hypothetical protein